MNGRAYPAAATAVDRTSGPVLAWNVEPTQFPAGTYPEMPAAAAAAVSPIVPAAAAPTAPPDPYGRCWQNQVDPSACFPYFGTLYGSSLPPPSYRMQPGCLSNLGQFWPPTPPPEGCVRYDGTNNLHYCSPLTPVFRHGESLPQNMLGVHQRLGHYTHLIDINKDAGLKRLDSCLDGIQRQKMLLASKHSKEMQQRACSCFECNEKSFARGTTQSVNKENISSGKLLEQKYSEDKLKSKSCKRTRDETYATISRSSTAYHPNASAINNFACSVEQNVARTMSMQGPNQPDFLVQSSQKLENPVSSSNCVQHEFLRPESNSFPISRCGANPLFTMTPSKDVTQVVQSTAKVSEQSRYDNLSAEKVSRNKLHVSTPGYESCLCPSEQTPSSSNSRRSTEKPCCFSPPYVSSRTLYHNYPENSNHSKTPNMLLMYGNGYNASPLKNVYFSYYESENFDMGSGNANRKNKGSFCKLEKVSNVNSHENHVPNPSSSHNNYIVSSASSVNSAVNSSYPHGSHYNSSTVPSDSYGCIYQSSCIEQQKASNPSYLNSSNIKRNDTPAFMEPITKITSVHIKQEKGESTDCKFQKSHPTNSSIKLTQMSDTITSNGVLNLSTSMRCPKIEPDDQINVSSAEPVRTSFGTPVSCSLSDVSVRSISSKSSEVCSQKIKTDDISSGYYSSIPAAGHLMKCHKVPDATTPQMHELESDCAPAVPEDLCPIAQIAPSGGAESAILSKMPTTGYEAPVEVNCQSGDLKETCEHNSSRNNEHDGLNLASHHLIQLEKPHSKDGCFPSFSHEENCTAESKASDPRATPLTEETADLCTLSHAHLEINSRFENISTSSSVKCVLTEDHSSAIPDVADCKLLGGDKAIVTSVKTEEEEKCESPEIVTELPILVEKKLKSESQHTDDVLVTKSEIVEPEECCIKKELIQDEAIECKEYGIKEQMAVEECHGLYVLLQGIAHKDNLDSSVYSEVPVSNKHENKTMHCENKIDISDVHNISHSSPVTPTKMKGLNLLCALAEKQFFVEFGEDVKFKSEVNSNEVLAVNLSSNYPAVKEEEILPTPLFSEDSGRKADCVEDLTTELKMRKRLAELQQKYREKQKELARLKPKKVKSLPNSEASHSPTSALDISYTSQNSCHSANCSKVSNTSTCDESTEKSCLLEADSPISDTVLKADTPQKLTKSQKSSPKSSQKSSSEESSTEIKSPNLNMRARNVSKGRTKPASRRMERISVARRRLELRRNVRSNILTRLKSAMRCNANLKKTMCNSRRNAAPQTESDISDGVKVLAKRQKKFTKRKILRSSEKTSSESSKQENDCSEELEIFSGHASMKSPKKRKPENPKKFMPAKQVRLTETIVAKQLRNRILFESPECLSKKPDEKHYDVPEELFDALRKCHLGDGNQNTEEEQCETVKAPELQELKPVTERESENVPKKTLKMTLEYLLEDQRILAIEEGLFYAGCIKEVQSSDVYSIVLDGQRGNKKHLFSREEMLTQTILESKPMSLDELPEGTRVCAYWSHQYRCLYPGTVVRAPAPSPDWSEPRVFVEFDDGDSAQIAMKNIRFLPPDMQIFDEDMKDGLCEIPPFEFKEGMAELKGSSMDQRKRKRTGKDIKYSKLRKSDFSSSKANTSCSNDSNTEEYCGQEAETSSPSHRLEDQQLQNRQTRGNTMDLKVSRRTQKQLSKKRSGNKSRVKENCSQAEKSKKHKRYKDRHKHHHHHRHHHRHHRHCHHHRHCKKRKHHKRASNVDNIINVVIPSSSIPFSNLIAKSTRSSMKDAEAQCVGHSKKDNKQLPQPSGEMGDSKSVSTSAVKERGTSRKESASLTR